MAGGFSEDSVTCSVCSEQFHGSSRVPRILSCGHSFCEHCLSLILADSTVLCPKCRAPTRVIDTVASLPKNFDLIDAIAFLTRHKASAAAAASAPEPEAPPSTPCDNDCKSPATLHCVQCDAFVCGPCDESIHSSRILKKHDRVPIKEALQAKSKHEPAMCHLHKKNQLELFCTTDFQPVCTLCCIIGSHKAHTFISLDEADSLVDAKVEEARVKMAGLKKTLEAASTELLEFETQLLSSTEAALDKVSKEFSKIQSLIKKKEEATRKELLESSKFAQAKIEGQRKMISEHRVGITSSMEDLSKDGLSSSAKFTVLGILGQVDAQLASLKKNSRFAAAIGIDLSGFEVLSSSISVAGAVKIEKRTMSTIGDDFDCLPDLVIDEKFDGSDLLKPGAENMFRVVTVQSGGTLTAAAWDGRTGGMLKIKAREIKVEKGGKIDMSGKGYRGGKGGPNSTGGTGFQGESSLSMGSASVSCNGIGGGAGSGSGSYGSVGGGGGGNETAGSDAELNRFSGQSNKGGAGGLAAGKSLDSVPRMGGGGGSGFAYSSPGVGPSGGSGGGAIWLIANVINLEGTISSDGLDGASGTAMFHSGGGGGAGGDILIEADDFENKGTISVKGGKGGKHGGDGGNSGITSCGGVGGSGKITVTKIQSE